MEITMGWKYSTYAMKEELTTSTEKIPSWEANTGSTAQEIPPLRFKETEGLLP
jgi:hypothetical protein